MSSLAYLCSVLVCTVYHSEVSQESVYIHNMTRYKATGIAFPSLPVFCPGMHCLSYSEVIVKKVPIYTTWHNTKQQELLCADYTRLGTLTTRPIIVASRRQ